VIIMPGNDGGAWWGWLAGRFPGRIGSLVNPSRWRTPVTFAPYACDNGAFVGFNAEAFVRMLEKARWHRHPMWVVVPDSVGNRNETLRMWKEWRPRLDGWTLAMAVQDGMTAADVPKDASVIFVGGSTQFKWSTVRGWCRDFPRVHVGRVNTERHLWMAHEAGAESCDGTGWMRNITHELPGLIRYLEQSSGKGRPQMRMESIIEQVDLARLGKHD
jgi:hypothetical protein